jgi:crotonobetainyl-CoA:carnitine CoA-transferase CaiB-like acyl-CoA transferase
LALRGEHTEAVLSDCGFSATEIDALRSAKAI